MFSRRTKPLSSKSPEVLPKHISDKAVILSYTSDVCTNHFAMSTPSTRPLYDSIEEILDAPEDLRVLRSLIGFKVRSLGADISMIRIDEHGNHIVTINQPGKPSKELIWHPINVVTHTFDTDINSISEPQPAYVVISHNTSLYRKVLGMSSIPKLPDCLYLLSDTPHARANFDRLYRSHLEAIKQSATPVLAKKPKHDTILTTTPAADVHTTISPLHRAAHTAPTPVAEPHSRLSSLSLPKPRPESARDASPTTASYTAFFSKGLRDGNKPSSSVTPWRS